MTKPIQVGEYAPDFQALGVFEDLDGLRFEPTINYRQRNYLDI